MKKLVNREIMQEIDRITMEEIGIPGMVLMERAACKVSERVMELLQSTDCGIESGKAKVLAVCGVGNNGGDGVAAARILYGAGINAAICVVGNPEKMSVQMRQQIQIAERVGVPFVCEPSYNDYSIVLDALFGVGLTRPIIGEFANVIEEMNACQAKVIAIDLPSGICADDGSILNIAIQADVTVTFGYCKVGLIRSPGREKAGKVYIEDIGFPSMVFDQAFRKHPEWKEYITYTNSDLQRMPKRPEHSNKGTFGTVLVVAGSKGMSGACYFSAKAALRTGAGLVKILTAEENRQILQTLLPEAVVTTYDEKSLSEETARTAYVNLIQSADVIVVGPGLGVTAISEEILRLVLENTKVWTVVDADGINILANWVTQRTNADDHIEVDGDRQIRKRMKCVEDILPQNVILTPHLKEFSRLIQCDIEKINKMFIDTIDLCSYNKMLIYIIKDSVTTVFQGKKRYLNTSGNNGLATGGTGDVLTGMISGFLAQGSSPFEAACLGVYVHGLTSENYSSQHFPGSMIASDVIEYIGNVLNLK